MTTLAEYQDSERERDQILDAQERRTRRRPRKHPEQALQQQVARYLDLCLLPPVFWTAVGHGGGGRLRGKILKGMGVKAGVPDILIMTAYGAVFIELKSPGAYPSAEQREVAEALWVIGVPVAVCRSLDDVRAALKRWGIRTREVEAA